MEFTDHLSYAFVVVMKVVDLLNSEGGVGPWVVFCSLEQERSWNSHCSDRPESCRARLLFLHPAKRITAQVGSHHVQTVGPVGVLKEKN